DSSRSCQAPRPNSLTSIPVLPSTRFLIATSAARGDSSQHETLAGRICHAQTATSHGQPAAERTGVEVAGRKVILQMMVTIDGFVAGPDDEMDWIDNDPVMGEAHLSLAEGADAAVIGHRVYHGMAQYWPQAAANPDAPNNEAEFGKLMNEMNKI